MRPLRLVALLLAVLAAGCTTLARNEGAEPAPAPPAGAVADVEIAGSGKGAGERSPACGRAPAGRDCAPLRSAPVPAAPAAAPRIQHWTTPNGARVYFVETRELPMVDVRVVFAAGSARDGGKAGLAALTAALLDQGAGGRSADAIAEALEGVGAVLGTESLRDMAVVSLRTLSEPRLAEVAYGVLADVIARPDFRPADFERQRARMEVGLRIALQRPGELAERAFYRAVYGDHPYASPPGGTPESVRALTREDVVAFHRRWYVARNAVVAIVGDLDRTAAERLARRIVAGLPAGEPAPPLPPVRPLARARTVRIAHPSAQAHVWVGQPGMRRGDPDYFALYVGNHVLGGSGLTSRLFKAVREARGLSYSVYSYFFPMSAEGPFVAALQTEARQAAEALAVLRAELERFVREGPTEAELVAAKRNITGGFPLRIDSNRRITEYVAMIGFYGLPLDWLERFNERVEAVTAAQVREAFRRRLRPGRMVTVIVGPPGAGTPSD